MARKTNDQVLEEIDRCLAQHGADLPPDYKPQRAADRSQRPSARKEACPRA